MDLDKYHQPISAIITPVTLTFRPLQIRHGQVCSDYTKNKIFFKNLFSEWEQSRSYGRKTWENFVLAHRETNWALDTSITSTYDPNDCISQWAWA